jgi:hypothetical protein
MTGTAHDRIETWHLDDDTALLVRGWFAGQVPFVARDGTRSVHLAAPHRPEGHIKIKGAGLDGGAIDFTRNLQTGPRAPLFDFNGRFMEDVASGHDAAWLGGATAQQAVAEYRVTAAIAATGRPVAPCLGYGRIVRGGQDSWFSVLDWSPGWADPRPAPGTDIADWESLMRAYGPAVTDLAVETGLIGYHWYVRDGAGWRWRDLHPYRMADPLVMSAASWVMQVYFGIHIRCNQISFAAIPKWNLNLPPEAAVWPLADLCPGVTLSDLEALRRNIVAPYMVGPPKDFDPMLLWRQLTDNPITAALLARCPAAFTRF